MADEGLRVAIVLRTDVFREKGGPVDVFDAVNETVAARIARCPLVFPTLREWFDHQLSRVDAEGRAIASVQRLRADPKLGAAGSVLRGM